MEILTPVFVINVLFTAIAFFTVLKLLSSNVYLNYHRLLPTMAAVIMIHNFYEIIIPFESSEATQGLLRLLCDMCAMVILFTMFDYLVLVKKPKYKGIAIIVSIAVMVFLCGWNFVSYELGMPYFVGSEHIALGVIGVGSIYTAIFTKRDKLFERDDKIAAYAMLFAFWFSFVGYFIQSLFHDQTWILGFIYSVNCAIYFYMAQTNRIEDPAIIMSDAIFNQVKFPMAIMNSEFKIVDANKSAAEAFPKGLGLEFAFEDNYFKNKCLVAEELVNNCQNEKELHVGDKWYMISWTEVKANKSKGYIFSCNDVTSSHEEVVMAKEETKEKSKFLAHMTHELRSPLHAIIGVSDILLSKHDISTKNRGLVQHIKKASDGLLEVVNAILDYSKLDAGKFSFVDKKYNIEEMLEQIAYSNIVNLQSKPVDFAIDIKTEYPKYLFGDSLRLREVFQNLLSNAVKFTSSGSVKGEFAFEILEEDKVKISFAVIDTGIGMTQEQIDKVFKEYVSLSDKVEVEGTGLGLAITKQLIELMGGEIRVESDGVSGSVFSGYVFQKLANDVMLPMKTINRRSMNVNNGAYDPNSIRAEWIYPEARVLVADDMKINQEILSQILAPLKCHVDCVLDGRSAVEAVRGGKYDLVLLDQMMTPMSGTDAADAIREFSSVPIVLVTANTEDNIHELIIEHGINDYVGKPIHIQQISRVLDTYMPADMRQRNFDSSIAGGSRRNSSNLALYGKTLETFIKEMEPLLLHLPSYSKNNRDMFKIKVHGIKGVSRQIGRETFADQAEIMEMAAKAEHWAYVDKHLDEFLNSLCDVVEDVTMELSEIAPEKASLEEIAEKPFKHPKVDDARVNEIFKNLLEAFEAFDLVQIEAGINLLENMPLSNEHSKILSKVIDAYDELEYEKGSEVLSVYLDNSQ